MADTELERAAAPKLSETVWALGFVSFFMDACSEMVYPLIPIFLKTVLGAPAIALGIIEGFAESTASLMRFVAGHLSDKSGRRKPLAALGYALGAVSKPLMGLVSFWPFVLLLRLTDRFGKGIRSSPRDALITESTPQAIRGRAFGLHRTMDTWGAVLGPLLGGMLFLALSGSLSHKVRMLLFLAGIPGLLSVLTILFFVKDRPQRASAEKKPEPQPLPRWGSLSPLYRRFILIAILFSIGNSSDLFLVLRAEGMNIGVAHILFLYSSFNVVEALLSYRIGVMSDRIGRRPLIVTGYLVFAVVYLGFALAPSRLILMGFFLLYGLYYALTQGVQRAFAADFADPKQRAAQIGAYQMAVGLTLLPASVLAGWLYQEGRSLPFLLGAVTALASALLLSRLPRPVQAAEA